MIGTCGAVDQHAGLQRERVQPFDVGLLLQQHAAHVGMFRDRYRRRIRAAVDAALAPFAGVGQRLVVARQ